MVLNGKNTGKIIRKCPNPKVGIINNVVELKGTKAKRQTKLKSFIKQNIVSFSYFYISLFKKQFKLTSKSKMELNFSP